MLFQISASSQRRGVIDTLQDPRADEAYQTDKQAEWAGGERPYENRIPFHVYADSALSFTVTSCNCEGRATIAGLAATPSKSAFEASLASITLDPIARSINTRLFVSICLLKCLRYIVAMKGLLSVAFAYRRL